MSDPVPAITEAAATGEVAKIFGDIRRVLAVDVVNLIWRHLATLDGALPWAWTTLRPLYVDGTIAAEARALHADIDLPPLPVFPPEVFVAAGLREDDVTAIGHILAAYHHTNAMALIALSALLNKLDGKASILDAVAPRGAGALDPQPEIPLPRLLNLADLQPETSSLVMMLKSSRNASARSDPRQHVSSFGALAGVSRPGLGDTCTAGRRRASRSVDRRSEREGKRASVACRGAASSRVPRSDRCGCGGGDPGGHRAVQQRCPHEDGDDLRAATRGEWRT